MKTSYSQLITDIQLYLEDNGAEFTAEMPVIINKALLLCARGMNLKMYVKEQTVATVAGQDVLDLTSIAPLRVDTLIHENGKFVERRSQSYVKMHGGSGKPLYHAPNGVYGVELTPTPDSAYSLLLTYLSRPEDLSDAAPTNWFTDHVADLLLTACLVEACRFLKNEERAVKYEQDLVGLFTLANRDFQDHVHTEGS